VRYAVVRAGGLQFKVSEGDRIRVPRIRDEVGNTIELPEVLALSDGGDLQVGQPVLDGVSVSAEITAHGRHRKVIVYKKKRRKGYELKKGHRQDYTELRITGIAGQG
jgi:large subunit ribosomal protein L21